MCEQQGRASATVLIMDDDGRILAACREILEHGGYRVLAARDGGEGMDIFREQHEEIDVVVMDWIMPGIDGHHWIRPILAMDAQTKLIFCTGHVLNEAVLSELNSEGVELLKKPFGAHQLLGAVERALATDEVGEPAALGHDGGGG